ncbi:MAG: UvrD-helicase domain-containing protein [Marinilabiliales bacterium]|nr:UvrD-helicase domain-containing protein [Marinilabiliales bacterium]
MTQSNHTPDPSTYLDNLNEVQKQAVLNPEGPSLIIAGAGSGKTRVLTYRIAHLLKNGIPASSILALTFTNKAAREMKERITSVVGPNISRYLWMGTFHSIFSRILRAEAALLEYPSNFTIYDTQDSKSLIRTVIKSLSLDENVYKPSMILGRISAAKNNLILPHSYRQQEALRESDQAARIPRTAEIYEEYARRCRTAGAMDFDDLLLMTNVLFKRFPETLLKYQHLFRYILVDEYQDTNFSQYLIVKKLAELHHNLSVVGDDAQSIYSFRGARIENILNFKNDYPDFQVFKLEQNYRSTQTIVNAANSIIAKNKNQLQKTVYSENDQGARIKVLNALNDQEEGFLVANEIFQKRMSEHDRWADFAILYRTNAQSRVFEEVLRKRNIPYKIYGGLSFYQRKEIKDLLAYFRLVVNDRDDESFKRVVNYPARGIGATTLGKLEEYAADHTLSMLHAASEPEHLQQAGLTGAAARKVLEFSELIQRFTEHAVNLDASEASRKIASESGILSELYQDKSPETVSRYENTEELLNAIHQYTIDAREQGREPLLSGFLEEVSLLTDQDNEKEEDFDKVTLMTVHSSKGLEFNTVFIVGLEENLFPSGFSGTMTLFELEEERRLFYVALTRSRTHAFLSFAQQRFKWGKTEFCHPSRFIGEIDPQYLDLQNSRYFQHHVSRESNSLSNGHSSDNFFTGDRSRLPAKGSATLGNHYRQVKSGIPTGNFQSDPPEQMKIGMMVEHERFGRGKIVDLEGDMPDRKAKVFFANAGEKQLLLRFAKLKIIE